MASQTNWWQKFFDDNFAVLLDRENDPELAATAAFLKQKFDLAPGARVYDQCCGTGALSLAFARQGLDVVGVDQAASYIAKAQLKTAAENPDLKTAFHTADAFGYVVDPPCDAAVNWYSSFGYAENDAQNIKMFERLFDSLRPGGHVAVEYMHVPQLLANFRESYTRPLHIGGQTVDMEKRARLDHERGMVSSTWVYHFPDGRACEGSGESRMYMPADIGALLEKSGFKDVEFFGGVHGEALTKDSPRVICTGLKP